MAASHYSELVVNYIQPKNRIYQNTRTSRPTDYLGNNTVRVAKSLFKLKIYDNQRKRHPMPKTCCKSLQSSQIKF